jgi:hypothetical protein
LLRRGHVGIDRWRLKAPASATVAEVSRLADASSGTAFGLAHALDESGFEIPADDAATRPLSDYSNGCRMSLVFARVLRDSVLADTSRTVRGWLPGRRVPVTDDMGQDGGDGSA